MKKSAPAANPAEYVSSLSGWQRTHVESLRAIVTDFPELAERIKWGHLVYTFNGPVLLIRAEERRVLFGFWRGKRLREIEKRLKPGGKYGNGHERVGMRATNLNPRKCVAWSKKQLRSTSLSVIQHTSISK